MPETRLTRRKAKAMRGVRSKSVDRLEIDDLEHFSEQRLYVRARRILPRPFGRKLIEDRWAGVGGGVQGTSGWGRSWSAGGERERERELCGIWNYPWVAR